MIMKILKALSGGIVMKNCKVEYGFIGQRPNGLCCDETINNICRSKSLSRYSPCTLGFTRSPGNAGRRLP